MEVATYAGPPALSADDSSVSGLVRLALEQNVSVEVLERLVALQEQVAQRDARAAFFEAVADFQERCPEISKSAKAKIQMKNGGQFAYSYAPLDGITRTIRPHLRAVGLSYSWDIEPGATGFLDVVAVLRHILGHEERARFPVPIGNGGRMSAAQEHGAALTYGKRQSLTSVLGLTTTDDDIDGAAGQGVEKITRGAAADLEALADEVKANKEKFLEIFAVASFEDLTVADAASGRRMLEAKRR